MKESTMLHSFLTGSSKCPSMSVDVCRYGVGCTFDSYGYTNHGFMVPAIENFSLYHSLLNSNFCLGWCIPIHILCLYRGKGWRGEATT